MKDKRFERDTIPLAPEYLNLMTLALNKDYDDALQMAEDEIANARKYYNGTVRIYNDKVQMFPSNILANIFWYKSKNMFEAKANERENVSVKL